MKHPKLTKLTLFSLFDLCLIRFRPIEKHYLVVQCHFTHVAQLNWSFTLIHIQCPFTHVPQVNSLSLSQIFSNQNNLVLLFRINLILLERINVVEGHEWNDIESTWMINLVKGHEWSGIGLQSSVAQSGEIGWDT